MLLFSTEAAYIRSTLPLSCWTSDPGINALVTQTYDYIDTYKTAPGPNIIYDILSILQISDDSKKILKPVIENCERIYPDIQSKGDWIKNRLEVFHKGMVWEAALEKGLALQQNGKYAELDNLMQTALKQRLVTFDPGYTLADIVRNAIVERDNPLKLKKIILGIPGFDDRGIYPEEGGVFLWIAPAKRGKSWALAYCGRQAIAQGLKVLHISLEMDQQKSGIRYLQSLQAFYSRGISPNKQFVRFVQNAKGEYLKHDIQGVKNLPHINDPGYLERLLESYTTNRKGMSDNLRLKQFATGTLTIPALKAYIEQLRQTGFYPDVLILDYIDIMDQGSFKDGTAYRMANSKLYIDFRGLCVEENLIGITATQGNRDGAKTETNSETVSENYGRIAQVDCAVAINQKKIEKDAGLCRLTVTSGRNVEDGVTVVVEQDLSAGQFAINSQDHTLEFAKQYTEILKAFTE